MSETFPAPAARAAATWQQQAACQYTDPDLFFPDLDDANWKVAAARKICAACPVRAQCLEHAVSSKTPLEGVWGGLTMHERRELRRARGTTRAYHRAA